MKKDLIINKYQVALFPVDLYVTDLNSLLVELKKINVFFNGVGTIIPIPSNAPREIPRILLRSKDNSVGCDISFDKVSIFWPNVTEKPNFTVPISDIQSVVDKISDVLLLSHTSAKTVKRVGYITEYYYEIDEPVKIISGKTIYSSIAGSLRNFTLTFEYKFSLDVYADCNEVVIINSNAITQKGKKRVVMLTHDINTIQTADVKWGKENIKKFIVEVNEKSEKKKLKDRFFIQND